MGLDLLDFEDRHYAKLSSFPQWKKYLIGFPSVALSYWYHKRYLASYHELGHVSRRKALGYNKCYFTLMNISGTEGYQTENFITYLGKDIQKNILKRMGEFTFMGKFLDDFIKKQNIPVTEQETQEVVEELEKHNTTVPTIDEIKTYICQHKACQLEDKILCAARPCNYIIQGAGGLNNTMFDAENIYKTMCWGKLRRSAPIHLACIFNKFDTLEFLYFPIIKYCLMGKEGVLGGDFLAIFDCYKTNKILDSKGQAYRASLLVHTISFASSCFNMYYDLSLRKKINNSFFEQIVCPNISSYFTTYGISSKFLTGFKFNLDNVVLAGWESVLWGKKKNELSLDFFHRFDHECRPEVAVSVTLGNFKKFLDASNFSLSCSATPFGFLSMPDEKLQPTLRKVKKYTPKFLEKVKIDGRISLFSSKSLFGERHTPKFFYWEDFIQSNQNSLFNADYTELTASAQNVLQDLGNKNLYSSSICFGITIGG